MVAAVQYAPVSRLLKFGLAALAVVFLCTACDKENEFGLQAQNRFEKTVPKSQQWGLPVMEYYYDANPERLEITVPVGEDITEECYLRAGITLTVFDKDRRPSIQNPDTNEWTNRYTKVWDNQFFHVASLDAWRLARETDPSATLSNSELLHWRDLELKLTVAVDGSVANDSPGMWLTQVSGHCKQYED